MHSTYPEPLLPCIVTISPSLTAKFKFENTSEPCSLRQPRLWTSKRAVMVENLTIQFGPVGMSTRSSHAYCTIIAKIKCTLWGVRDLQCPDNSFLVDIIDKKSTTAEAATPSPRVSNSSSRSSHLLPPLPCSGRQGC